jgi:hypothetical protein
VAPSPAAHAARTAIPTPAFPLRQARPPDPPALSPRAAPGNNPARRLLYPANDDTTDDGGRRETAPLERRTAAQASRSLLPEQQVDR